MANLKDRLLAHGLTVAEVAAKVPTPTAHLYNLLNRVRRPRVPLAKAIERASGGVIRWTEFFEEPEEGEHQPPPPDVLGAVS